MQFINIIMSALTSVYNWFASLVNSLGMYSYVVGVLIVMLICRFILRPLFAGGISFSGSDSASRFMEKRIKSSRSHQYTFNEK